MGRGHQAAEAHNRSGDRRAVSTISASISVKSSSEIKADPRWGDTATAACGSAARSGDLGKSLLKTGHSSPARWRSR